MAGQPHICTRDALVSVTMGTQPHICTRDALVSVTMGTHEVASRLLVLIHLDFVFEKNN